jgi:hypothetical protein
MGMFSWLCNECQNELIQGEHVRLAEYIPPYNEHARLKLMTYDGYGCGFTEEVIAYHDRCWNRSKERSMRSSSWAPNQGFGWEKLEFLEGFKDEVPFKCYVLMNVSFDRYVLTNEMKMKKVVEGNVNRYVLTNEMKMEKVVEGIEEDGLLFDSIDDALNAFNKLDIKKYTELNVIAIQGDIKGTVYHYFDGNLLYRFVP